MNYTTEEDIFALKSVTQPVLSHDETKYIFIKTILNEKENRYEDTLYLYDLKKQDMQALTYGTEIITHPKWSPKDTYITFLSSRNEEQQLYALRLSGGEAEQLTHSPNGISNYLWAPDEAYIYLTKLKVDEKEEEKAFKEAVVINRIAYKADGVGLVAEEKLEAIFKLTLKTKALELVIDENVSFSLETINHQGDTLVYSVNRTADPDREFSRPLYLYDLKTNIETSLIELAEGTFFGAEFSYDDQKIAFGGYTLAYKNASQSKVYVYDIATKEYQIITDFDNSVGDHSISDFLQRAESPLVKWTKSDTLYTQVSIDGAVILSELTLSGISTARTEAKQHIYGYDISTIGNYALVAVSKLNFPGEIFKLDLKTGKMEQLTFFNDAYLKETNVVCAEELISKTSDGTDVHGWLMKPATYKTGEKYPLIVNVHGGPHAMYAHTYFHEMQVFAAAGYGVLYVNPRGSHSYGQAYVDDVRGRYGTIDYDDIMGALDTVLQENEWVDSDRLGLTGGSYGGFMTNWIVTQTDRFKAAATQRSISNWISFNGVSDIGYFFSEWQHKVSNSDIKELWDISPLKYVEKINTPLLILHGEQDLRCPIEQAEQLYIALKLLDKETTFIRFPDSNHNLSRSGMPNLRLARLRALVDWFDKYLLIK